MFSPNAGLDRLQDQSVQMGVDRMEAPGMASSASYHTGRLLAALGLTASFMVIEVLGGLWTGSLALLADAGHMLTDVGGLSMSLLAVRFAETSHDREYLRLFSCGDFGRRGEWRGALPGGRLYSV